MKEDHPLLFTLVYSIWLLPRSNTMNNHGLSALVKLGAVGMTMDCTVTCQRSLQWLLNAKNTITHYYWTLMSHGFNSLSIVYIMWPCIIKSNDKNLHRCYIAHIMSVLTSHGTRRRARRHGNRHKHIVNIGLACSGFSCQTDNNHSPQKTPRIMHPHKSKIQHNAQTIINGKHLRFYDNHEFCFFFLFVFIW